MDMDDHTDVDEAPAEEAPEEGAKGGLSRTLVVALIAVVAIVVIAVALTQGGQDQGGTGTTVACEEGGSSDPVAQGLEPEPEPDSLPPGVLCAFTDDTGVPVDSFLGGEPVVVNFWATWCAPCTAEMPDFQQVHEAADGVFRLVGINTQDSPPMARDFAEELGITYDLLRDPLGDYFIATNGFGMPTTLFVTPDGDIRHRHTGPLTVEQMTDLLAEHLDVTVEVDA